MKARTKLFSILGLSLALAGAVATAQTGSAGKPSRESKGTAPKIGEAAPAWTLTDINGKQHSLAEYKGKIVVLDWVNPQCPVCKGAHEDGRVQKMLDEFKTEGVVFLGVNSSHFTTAEENKKALEKYKVEYPVLLDVDGKVGKSYDARTTPHLFVIDTEGVLRYSGAIDDGNPGKAGTTNYVLQAVKQIKAGETVTPDTTKPYGCSVKYGKPEGAGKSDDAASRGDKKGKKSE